VIKSDNGLPFPVFQPEISWDGGVMLVGFAVSFDPGVEFALADGKPADKPIDWDTGFIAP
jgi:hypothetical protein